MNAPLQSSAHPLTQSLRFARVLSEPHPSFDQVIAEFAKNEGTTFGSYDGYVASLTEATVFGKSVRGLHAAFVTKLRAAEKEILDAAGSDTVDRGIESIGGLRRGDGWHNWGVAIDFNYDATSCMSAMKRSWTASWRRCTNASPSSV